MGDRRKKRRKPTEETASSSSSPSPSESSSDDTELDSKRRHQRRKDRGGEKERSGKKGDRDRDRDRRRRRRRRRRKSRRDERSKKMKRKKKRDYDSESDSFSEDGSDLERIRIEPELVVRDILKEFPNVGEDLRQLLQMIDNGQAVDIKGIAEISLKKHLKKLFLSLDLKENGDRIFLLPSNVSPTLEVIGHLIHNHPETKEQQLDHSAGKDINSVPLDADCRKGIEDENLSMPCPKDDAAVSRRRVIGPEMPSAELLAAAAKLTEAQDELRDAELEEDTEFFIGPPPPAVVAEAESANEAERFEEVTRIMGADVDCPYDVLGVNQNMSDANMKKRYWKLSLLVHPDKCTHPQAHQAFIMLNKSYKELQDPDKRKVLDEKIRLKEEQEKFKVELRAMREAAQWRRLQGISMEGDDELLAQFDVKVAPTRDEWMTKLPPERNPNSGMPMQSTQFSRNTKEGRGDTTAWTDTPTDRAQKAKINYLEAYNEAAALASNEEEKKRSNSDADLVDKYNKAKRSKSLVQKHKEESMNRSNKKSKQKRGNEEWAGQHPWKPWDREKDLTAGRQNVKLDPENMSQGLTSKFSSANFQRNFL